MIPPGGKILCAPVRPAGSVSLALDLAAIPGPMGPMAVMAGDPRAFQYWTRDTSLTGASSNFSSAVTLTFQ